MNRQHVVIRVERILSSLINDAGIEHAVVTQAARFIDLGLDDLDLYNAICSAEEVFGVSLQDQILTSNSKVFDFVDAIERARSQRSKTQLAHDPRRAWEDFPPRRATGGE